MRNLIEPTQTIAGFLEPYQLFRVPQTARILPEEITAGMLCLYFPQGEAGFAATIRKDDEGVPADWIITNLKNRDAMPILCTLERLQPHGVGIDVVPKITMVAIDKEPETKIVPLSSVRRPLHPELMLADLCLKKMDGLPMALPRFKGIAKWTVKGHGSHASVTIQASKRKPAFQGHYAEAKVGYIGEDDNFAIETQGAFPWLLLVSMLEVTKQKKELKNH